MRSILVHADTGTATGTRLQTALDIARRMQAHLTVHINTPLAHFVAMDPFGGVYPLQDMMIRAQEAETALVTRLTAQLSGEDVPFNIITTSGEPIDEIVRAARLADLVVVPLDARESTSRSAAETVGGVAIAVGSIVLALPVDLTFTLAGRAMIAWNGSHEGANALRRAIPLLALASEVHVITIGHDKAKLPAADALEYLSRHDIHAALDERKLDGSIEETIQLSAVGIRADWVVMGAYGHSRMREMVFGGVTRYLLDNAKFPLLLAH